jgi:hypothetical protein
MFVLIVEFYLFYYFIYFYFFFYFCNGEQIVCEFGRNVVGDDIVKERERMVLAIGCAGAAFVLGGKKISQKAIIVKLR